MTGDNDSRTPLVHQVLLVAVPIVVAELCIGVREWVRREHKAALRRRRGEPERPA